MTPLLAAILLTIIPAPHNPPSPAPEWLCSLVESRTGYALQQTPGRVELVSEPMHCADAWLDRQAILDAIALECAKMHEAGWELSAVWLDRAGELCRVRLAFRSQQQPIPTSRPFARR